MLIAQLIISITGEHQYITLTQLHKKKTLTKHIVGAIGVDIFLGHGTLAAVRVRQVTRLGAASDAHAPEHLITIKKKKIRRPLDKQIMNKQGEQQESLMCIIPIAEASELSHHHNIRT